MSVTTHEIPVLVLHDIGDEAGGGRWRAAFEQHAAHRRVLAPDLPGHGNEPPPVDGNYEIADAALFAVRVLHEQPDMPAPVVVGVGMHGWAALTLALGGRASGLVLVDALEVPTRTPQEWAAELAAWMRALADDPAAMAPPPERSQLDPRLRHRPLPMNGRELFDRGLATLRVPWLTITEREPDVVAPRVMAWIDDVVAASHV